MLILMLILSSGEGDGAGSFPGSRDDPEQPGDPDLTGPLLLPHGGLRGGHQLSCCPENHHVPGDHQTRGPQGKTGFFIYFMSVLRQFMSWRKLQGKAGVIIFCFISVL